jgi:acetyltransferase (GNAT) family protein
VGGDPLLPGLAGELDDLYVVPDARDRSIGRRFAETAIARLGDAGAEVIWTHVDTNDEKAQAFWAALGFKGDVVPLLALPGVSNECFRRPRVVATLAWAPALPCRESRFSMEGGVSTAAAVTVAPDEVQARRSDPPLTLAFAWQSRRVGRSDWGSSRSSFALATAARLERSLPRESIGEWAVCDLRGVLDGGASRRWNGPAAIGKRRNGSARRATARPNLGRSSSNRALSALDDLCWLVRWSRAANRGGLGASDRPAP